MRPLQKPQISRNAAKACPEYRGRNDSLCVFYLKPICYIFRIRVTACPEHRGCHSLPRFSGSLRCYGLFSVRSILGSSFTQPQPSDAEDAARTQFARSVTPSLCHSISPSQIKRRFLAARRSRDRARTNPDRSGKWPRRLRGTAGPALFRRGGRPCGSRRRPPPW